MRVYVARGERGLALHAFDRCRAVLLDQLDAQPSSETQRLAADIRSEAVARPALAEVPGVGGAVARITPRPSPHQPARPGPGHEAAAESALRTGPRPEADTLDPRHAARSTAPRGGARVGVLPLQLVGTSEAEAHLSTCLAEEITAALARFRWLFLASSNALARFCAQTRDEVALRRNFGLDFVLDGVVQRAGDRLRVSLRLIDLRGGDQVVWSRQFDGSAHDLFSLQDAVAAEVAAQVDPEILLIEAQRAAIRPLHQTSAYDLMLRAVGLIGRLEKPTFMLAGDLLRQAIALEPDWAAGYAWLAYWHIFLTSQAWSEDEVTSLEEAGQLAERAATLDPQDAKALTIVGHVRAFLHRRLREAITLHERALTLNPNLPMAWNFSGMAYAYLGDLDEAERRIDCYKKLSPADPQAFYFDNARVIVRLLKHDHAGAIEIGREVTSLNPGFTAAIKSYLSALGHGGAGKDAAALLARLLALEPKFTVSRFLATTAFQRQADRDHFAAGLRLAGVAE